MKALLATSAALLLAAPAAHSSPTSAAELTCTKGDELDHVGIVYNPSGNVTIVWSDGSVNSFKPDYNSDPIDPRGRLFTDQYGRPWRWITSSGRGYADIWKPIQGGESIRCWGR